ncbi:MAG: hypothetical protein ACRDHU_11910 [Actinomycetota bacterium]
MLRARRRSPGVILTSVVVAGLVASSCSGPRNEYVRNTSLRTAFKVPAEWTLFDKATLLGEEPGPQASTPDPLRWLVGIDGDPAPDVTHILDPNALDTDYPHGIALVQEFSFDDRDTSNLMGLRDYLFPVTALIPDPNSGQVVSYDDRIDRDGVRGVHVVFQFRASALATAQASADGGATDLQRSLLGGSGAPLLSPDYVTVNQTALVDAETSRVYFIAVLCSAECYNRNRSDIQSIVDSWTVLP